MQRHGPTGRIERDPEPTESRQLRLPTGLAAVQAGGNQMAVRLLGKMDVQREPDAGTSPAPPTPAANMTNDALLAEITRLEQQGSSSGDGGTREGRFTELTAERDRRVQAGQVWMTDAGAPGSLLQVAGGGEAARLAQPAQNPRAAAGLSVSPTFTSRQLNTTLAKHNVQAVVLADLDTTAPAAGAVPTPSLAPQIMGRFYPFLRAMTAEETAMVSQRGAVHLTPETNLPGIQQPGGQVTLEPSSGYRNLTDPSARRSSYFFAGEPSAAQFHTNLAATGPRGAMATIVVQGGDLPSGTMFRPLDSVLAVPGGYRGPATVILPGQPVPPGNGVMVPIGPPATMAESLQRQGTFSGHPLAAGVGAGLVAVVIEGGVVLLRTGELPSGNDLAGTGLAGTAGGAVGAVSENVAARSIASALGSNSGRVLIIFGRGGAGAFGGAIAAPVVEIGRMLMDEQQHSGTDYAARGGRAAVGGAVSGFLAAAAMGAVAGSVAPGVGTAIGFVVGAGAYMLTDWLVGDAVEQGIRSAAQ